MRYYVNINYKWMIQSFNCKETEKLWTDGSSKKLPHSIQRMALRKLIILNSSTNINDLKVPPANHLEKLKGKFKDKYSIRINDQYRIIFKWINNESQKVEIIDYH